MSLNRETERILIQNISIITNDIQTKTDRRNTIINEVYEVRNVSHIINKYSKLVQFNEKQAVNVAILTDNRAKLQER